jgi:hypothetical protein
MFLLLLQKVVRAIEAASYVMTELSKNKEEMDKSILHVAATGFVQQVQVRSSTKQPDLFCMCVMCSAARTPQPCCLLYGGTQEAQQLVLQAVKSAAPERNFEANNYFPMVQVRRVCSKLVCAGKALPFHQHNTSQLACCWLQCNR